MHEQGWTATGLEPDEAAREKAKSVHNVNLLPVEELYLLPADHFNVITLWHVLEHVHDLHPYMEQLKTVLKRGGRIFIAVPNYTSYDATRYEGFWAAYDVPRHLYHFSPESMACLLDSHGLQLHATQPMWYDSFYISMLSEKYKKGNGKGDFVRGMLTGAVSNIKAFIDKSKCSSLIYVIGK
jgi:SAM-dependent methyltransferase